MSPSFKPTNRAAFHSSSPYYAAPRSTYKCRATQRTPRFYLLINGEPCYLDIEFQKYKIAGEAKERQRIGRIAILNSKGEVVLDVYAFYPREQGVEKRWQPACFGVVTQDLLYRNGAVAAAEVEAWVAQIVKGRTVVVHGGKHDMSAFYYEKEAIWATSTVVDTQSLYGQVALPTLADAYLGMSIQAGGFHSPVEDADATRELHLRLHPYDRDAEVARIEAERAATPGQMQTVDKGQAPRKRNANGSSKRRNRKKGAAEDKGTQGAAAGKS
ncbi:hypothetical protein LTR36_004490 [Oleoguttula mirabilis]|uniref:Exonuclease domain-containing protein n=1 Tax=Oleoguttula mirabilis TaxID=1507867 RepID=A0AAV9JGS9_9PEZI|nr:hypothetical protein LTR36_004490 [Oleoguttula mirabilis]